jgi:hypothetical protein
LISRYSPERDNYRELIPIENIRFGDKVWSFNRAAQHWEPRLVLETFKRNYNGDIVVVQLEKETINATGGHPFWVIEGIDLEHRPLCDCLPSTEQNITPQGRWVYARDLQIGDVIQSREQGSRKVFGLTIEVTETLVYNFLVDDLHNYAVGENEILVHNNNRNFDDDLDYKFKRDKENNRKKPGHANEQKDVKAAQKGLTTGQKGKFDEELKKMVVGKKGNKTVPFETLLEVREEILKLYPNL